MKNNLKKIRIKKKVSPEVLGKHIGASKKNILLMETDKKHFTVKSLLQICGFLKISADELFDLKTTGLNKKTWDVCLYDSVVGFLLENCYRNKIEPNKKDIGVWAMLAYKATVGCHYDFTQTQLFTDALVKISLARKYPLPKPDQHTFNPR